MAKRNLYLNNTPVDEAKALYQKALGELLSPKAEWIPVTESLHKRGSLCEILFPALQCGGDGWNRG